MCCKCYKCCKQCCKECKTIDGQDFVDCACKRDNDKGQAHCVPCSIVQMIQYHFYHKVGDRLAKKFKDVTHKSKREIMDYCRKRHLDINEMRWDSEEFNRLWMNIQILSAEKLPSEKLITHPIKKI